MILHILGIFHLIHGPILCLFPFVYRYDYYYLMYFYFLCICYIYTQFQCPITLLAIKIYKKLNQNLPKYKSQYPEMKAIGISDSISYRFFWFTTVGYIISLFYSIKHLKMYTQC